MNLRESWEDIEDKILSPRACRSTNSRGRARAEEPCSVRTAFQRDRDRIIHSKAFRRLKHKTQALLLPEGDHVRTRLTHTLEVAQIGRTIARAMRLNEDLTEAIALGHDLGHTPFGHMGERVIDGIAKSEGLSGFHHAAQSLRVVDCVEKDGHGLNLTWEVRMGIVQHSKGQVAVDVGFSLSRPSSLEAWVVRVSDSVAYLNHDMDDALRCGMISASQIPECVHRVLGNTHGERISTMVLDTISSSADGEIRFSVPIMEAMETMRSFLYSHVYATAVVMDESPRVDFLVRTAYRLCREKNSAWDATKAIDFVSGMTDRFLMQWVKKECFPSVHTY